MRKIIFKAVVTSVILTFIAAGFSVAPSQAAAKKITLTFWDWGEMGFSKQIKKYEAAHPNIKVVEKRSEYVAHHQALKTALASGKGPDITGIEGSFMPMFMQYANKFVDLRSYGAAALRKDYLSWRFSPAVAKNGAIIGLPTDTGGMAVAYRTDLFEAAGLPIDPAAVSALWKTGSWSDFVKVAKQYSDKTGKKFVDSTQSIFNGILAQNPETFYSSAGKLVYGSNKNVAFAWQIASAMAPYSGSANIFSTEWNAGLGDGSTAAVLAPAWMLGLIKGAAKETTGKWNIATVPGGGGNWGGSWLSVTKGSKHPKEAADLIKFLLSPASQKQIFFDFGNFPSTPVVLSDPAVTGFKDPFFQNAPVGKIYASSMLSLKPVIVGPKQSSIDASFTNALATIAQGKKSAAEAWSSAIAEIEKNVGKSS